MTCPECGGKTRVYDSRSSEDSTYRRRVCLSCDYKFKTVEIDADMYNKLFEEGERNDIASCC